MTCSRPVERAIFRDSRPCKAICEPVPRAPRAALRGPLLNTARGPSARAWREAATWLADGHSWPLDHLQSVTVLAFVKFDPLATRHRAGRAPVEPLRGAPRMVGPEHGRDHVVFVKSPMGLGSSVTTTTPLEVHQVSRISLAPELERPTRR